MNRVALPTPDQRVRRIVLTWVALASLSGLPIMPISASAEVIPAQPVESLPTLTVSATRMERALNEVPNAITRIEAESIQRGNRQISLDEALQEVPGVFVQNPYNYAQGARIAIRGFGARANFGIRGIRLFVDGIPATTPDGQGQVDAIDLSSAEQIEVIRGPAAALYGAAAGGVIRVETESGPALPFAESRLNAGQNGFFNAQFKSGGQEGALAYLLSFGYLDFAGYRQNSETRSNRINAKLDYGLNQSSRLRLVFNRIDFPKRQDPGGLNLMEAHSHPRQARQQNLDFQSGETVRQERVGLAHFWTIDADQSLESRIHSTHRDFANSLPFASGGQVTFERHFYGTGLLYRRSGDPHTFSAGIEADWQEDHRKNFDNLLGLQGPLVLEQKERVRSLGTFAAHASQLSDEWQFSSALRYDQVRFSVDDQLRLGQDNSGRIQFDQFSPMIGLNWSPNSRPWAIYANLSSAFETPTTTELRNPDGAGFNPGLRPQTARNYELGIRGEQPLAHRSIRCELAVFQIDIEDSLVPFELAASPGRQFFRNAGESRHRGLEFALSSKLADHWSAALQYTWSDFKYQRFTRGGQNLAGNTIPGIPEHLAALRLDYNHPSGLFARWQTRFVGDLYADDANETRVNGYSISDLSVGYAVTHRRWTVEPYVNIQNIFDKPHFANIRINAFGGRFYEPSPRRHLFGGIRLHYEFGHQ